MLLMFSKYDGPDDVWFDEEERVYLSFPKLAAATVWHQVSKWILQVEVDASHLMWDREWFDAEEENSALELHHWRICLIETLDNLLETLEDKENNPDMLPLFKKARIDNMQTVNKYILQLHRRQRFRIKRRILMF